MLIYNYDKISKEYLYSSEANVDEMKTVKTGKICYLIPADATTKAPKKDMFNVLMKNLIVGFSWKILEVKWFIAKKICPH